MKTRRIRFLVILLGFTFIQQTVVADEPWAKHLGLRAKDQYNSVLSLPDGGCIASGYFEIMFSRRLLVTRYNDNGEVQWFRIFRSGSSDDVVTDEAEGIVLTPDGGILLVGDTNALGAGKLDALVMKLTSDGSVEWHYAIGGPEVDFFTSVCRANDGGTFVAGATMSDGNGSTDFWVLKLDPAGEVIWSRTCGGSGRDMAMTVGPLGKGGCVVGGYSDSFNGSDNDIWILALDEDGSIRWQKTLSSPGDDNIRSIAGLPDGDFLATGGTSGGGSGTYNACIVRFASDGTLLWQKTIGGMENDYGSAIVAGEEGTIAIAGFTESSSAGGRDCWLADIEPSGGILRQTSFGKPGLDTAYDVDISESGGFYIAGATESFDGVARNALIIKSTRNGDCGDFSHPADLRSGNAGFITRNTGTFSEQPEMTITAGDASNLELPPCYFIDEFIVE